VIEVTNSYEQAMADDARREAVHGVGWLVFLASLTAGVVLLAVHGLPGVPGWALWIAVGFVGGDLAGSVPATWRAVRMARDLRTCRVCRGAAVGIDELDQRLAGCSRRGHRDDQAPGTTSGGSR
jgi:hypothetical protein